MRNVLYVGNNLSSPNTNISSIQVVGSLLQKEGFTVLYASNKVNKELRMLDMIGTVIWNCRRVNYVIIDTYSTLNFYYALIISQLCRILGLKYITRLNGGNLPARLKRNPFYSKLIFKHAFSNVSPSLYLLEAFQNFGYKKLAYIPNTIEIDNYKFSERQFDSIKLLWVRSLSKIYNPKLALDVLKKLIEQGYKASLCMVGPDSDGSLKEVQEYAQKLQLEVHFTGKLTKEEWISLSKGYNIFINTTKYDNTPVSVIEAMALGLPIVSTNVGGMPYLIDSGIDGLLVPPNDAEMMAKAILEINSNKKLAQKIAHNARDKVEQFDWSAVKERWKTILK